MKLNRVYLMNSHLLRWTLSCAAATALWGAHASALAAGGHCPSAPQAYDACLQ